MFFKFKKKLIAENTSLKNLLEKEQQRTFEDYFDKNTYLSQDGNGFAVDFKGVELVKIFAASFWDIVQESDNYVILDLLCEDKSVEITIKKKGKLSPQDKLKKVERLLENLLKVNGTISESVPYREALSYINNEESLRNNYDRL